MISAAPSLKAGSEARLSVPLLGPIRKEWLARHVVYEPPHRFVDEQVRGPFRRWRHEHRVEPHAMGAELIDSIDLELPLGKLSAIFAGWYIRRMLTEMFRFRHDVTRSYVEPRS